MGYGWLNLGSLVCGLIACALPLLRICAHQGRLVRMWGVYAMASMSLCALAICLQVFYHMYLVDIHDWTALMDTVGAVAAVSAALLGVTAALNFIAGGMHLMEKKAEAE